MASNENNDQEHDSPMHLGLSGHHFSPEEIQDLLGVMGDDDHPHHHHHDGPSAGDGHAMAAPTSGEVEQSGNAGASSSSVASNSGEPNGTETAGSCTADGSAHTSSTGVPEEAKAQARSERKRCREKQRRSDVNRQFNDLTQLLQKIDSEEATGEDGKPAIASSSNHNRLTFNPANRVDLIARTIILLEKLHEANKKRKTEIASLQQQLEEAKRAGEDTAMKLKEAMLAPPGQPMNKQFMMMVPMMMSSDGSGAAMPMMNPYMPHAAAAMPQAYCPMPAQQQMPTAAAPPAGHAHFAPAAPAPAPAMAQAPSAPAPATTTAAPSTNPPPAAPGQPMMGTGAQQSSAVQQHPQQQQQQQPLPGYPYMMPAPHMGAGNYMMQMPAAPGAGMPGQPMTMVPHPMMQHQHHPQMQMMPMSSMMQHHQHHQMSSGHDSQNGHPQEQKESSSPSLNGGSNLAHCA